MRGARRFLQVIISDEDDEAVVAKKQEEALAEHVAAHPEDAGCTVKDFDWIVCEILTSFLGVGDDGRPRWKDGYGLSADEIAYAEREAKIYLSEKREAERNKILEEWSGNGSGNGHGG